MLEIMNFFVKYNVFDYNGYNYLKKTKVIKYKYSIY